jgi:hypothetical protein
VAAAASISSLFLKKVEEKIGKNQKSIHICNAMKQANQYWWWHTNSFGVL